MKYFGIGFLLVSLVVCASCSPKVTTALSSSRVPLQANEQVAVIDLSGGVPASAAMLGKVRVGDTGFTINCSYDTVISRAREVARAAGGNAIKITLHRTPSIWSSCHRIEADILYIPQEFLVDLAEPEHTNRPDSALLAEGCAMIHFYRFGGAGFLISYDIYAGDETIARISSNSRESLKIKALGETTFWARTEARSEVTIPVEAGYHYYVRCEIEMGVMVGRPRLERVDPQVGKMEYERIREKNANPD